MMMKAASGNLNQLPMIQKVCQKKNPALADYLIKFRHISHLIEKKFSFLRNLCLHE